jgi:hypothetical protein
LNFNKKNFLKKILFISTIILFIACKSSFAGNFNHYSFKNLTVGVIITVSFELNKIAGYKVNASLGNKTVTINYISTFSKNYTVPSKYHTVLSKKGQIDENWFFLEVNNSMFAQILTINL